MAMAFVDLDLENKSIAFLQRNVGFCVKILMSSISSLKMFGVFFFYHANKAASGKIAFPILKIAF